MAETGPARMGRRPMPIAINPEHQDLADSVRSLVARVAPSEVLHAAMENTAREPAALLAGGRRAGPAGCASGRIRRRAGIRHPRAGDRAGRVRLRRSARAVRAVGDRQCADRRARPERQGARRPGVGCGHRRLRAGLRADRNPAGRCPGDPRRGPRGAGGGAGIALGASRGDREPRRVGGAETPTSSKSSPSRASTRCARSRMCAPTRSRSATTPC